MNNLPPSSGLFPDKFVIINNNGDFVILAGWDGGYLNGSAWRRSSKITDVNINESYILVTTNSGSSYILYLDRYGFTSYSHSVYEAYLGKVPPDSVFHYLEKDMAKIFFEDFKK